MERRTVLRGLAAAGTATAMGLVSGTAIESLPGQQPGPARSPILQIGLAATGPAPATATVDVHHVQTPRCRYGTRPCAEPVTTSTLHAERSTVLAGERETWALAAPTTPAVDAYVVTVTTDETTRSLTAIHEADAAAVTDAETIDLTVPQTTDSPVTADLVGPLTLTVASTPNARQS